MAWTLVNDYPEVEEATRLIKAPGVNQFLVKYENQTFFESKVYFVDSTFFDVLTYKFVDGDESQILKNPLEAVISIAVSNKLFGGQ